MSNLMSTLRVVLVLLIFAIMVLGFVYWYISYKNKMKAQKEENNNNNVQTKTKVAKEYTKESIFKFMQFDKIEDNMIIQDNGTRYLMVIECEGINYDLMSDIEKTAVEAGFVQFLNTLRYPIQLYTQTRTLNISESVSSYREKANRIKANLDNKENSYNMMIKSENYNEEQAKLLNKEIRRLRNLYQYGLDVIEDIEKTSQNKNVLKKQYYIVVPYYKAEIGTELLDKEEERSLIFSELYTRAQALIRALFSCEMRSRILDSNELVELLYVAYNREDFEVYGVDKAIQAGYNELYSTAPDVLEKRMKSLDKKIKENAEKLLKETIKEIREEKAEAIKKKETDFEKLVKEMAETLAKENEKYIGEETSKKAIEKINNDKGGNLNEKGKKTRKQEE